MQRGWRWSFVFVLVNLCLWIGVVYGTSWEKLNFCREVGFCRRHRGREAIEPPSKVDPASIRIGQEDVTVTGVLTTPGHEEYSLRFHVFVLPLEGKRAFRLVIDDEEGFGDASRYSIPDIIHESVQPIELDSSYIDQTSDSTKVIIKSDPTFTSQANPCIDQPCLSIQYSPFRVSFLSPTQSGSASHESIVVNDRGLLHFEQHKFMKELQRREEERLERLELVKRCRASKGRKEDKSEDPESSNRTAEVEEDPYDYESDYDDIDSHRKEEVDATEAQAAQEVQEAKEAENFAEECVGIDLKVDVRMEKTLCDGCFEEKVKGGFTDYKVRGPESFGVDISFPSKKFIYGLGERTMPFSLPNTVDGIHIAKTAGVGPKGDGEPLRFYNLDVFEFEMDKPLGLYGSVPMIVARGEDSVVGMLWFNAAETYVDLQDEGSGRSGHWFSESGVMDVVFLAGPTALEVFEQEADLTGRPAMPNGFSLGYHQCRWNYRDDADARYVDEMFDKYNIPYDTLWLDIEHTDGKRYFTWDMTKFPDPTKLQVDVAARGRKMVTIIDPHVKVARGYALHDMASSHGLYVKSEDGTADYNGWCWPGKSSYLDFTASKVRTAWEGMFDSKTYPHFTEHLFTWNDMNEPSVFNGPEMTMPKSLKHMGGWEHRDLHNIYGYYLHRATFDGLLHAREDQVRPFVLSRAFFIGTQRYGAVWTGDNSASWEHLRSSVPMLLSLSVTGIVFCGADVGGFFGNPSEELLTRWYQVGAWQPFFRGHAHLDTNRREPWVFSPSTTKRIREAIIARYAYLPSWYTLFAAASLGKKLPFRSGSRGPPMRPLWWHYPGFDEEQEHFLVGDSLLIAAVLEEGAVTQKLRLPSQELWYDVFGNDGRPYRKNTIQADLDRMVVFQRGGSIVAKKERLRRSSKAMQRDPYTLVIAVDGEKTASGEVYLDDTFSYEFETNAAFVLAEYVFDGRKLTSQVKAGGSVDFEGLSVDVERIVVLGLKTAPRQVITADGRSPQISYADGVLEVKKPTVKMFSSWSIDFLE